MSAGDALIVEAVRTPIGRRDGMLSDWHPADLLARFWPRWWSGRVWTRARLTT